MPFALYVDDAFESYLAWRKHAIDVHDVLGTQRLLELRIRQSRDSFRAVRRRPWGHTLYRE